MNLRSLLPSARLAAAALTAVALLAPAGRAFADDVDISSFYEVTTKGSSEKVKAGGQGTWVFELHALKGAHISSDAPMRIQLSSTALKPSKTVLTLQDSTVKVKPGEEVTKTRFEVPFTAPTAGKATLDANAVFFICTDKLCKRQKQTLSLPVEVK